MFNKEEEMQVSRGAAQLLAGTSAGAMQVSCAQVHWARPLSVD